MPVDIPRLRYWFAAAAIATVAIVAGFYFYARLHVENSLAEVPKKIPSNVQQSTHGFSLSKSEGGHTLFTVRAARATQFKEGGRAELQGVNIAVYGRESNRFDQIYGSDFSYDPQTGNVVAKGIVHIDLQGDTTGIPHPDQSPPQELKNPIHLKTSGLVFNQNTGDAYTNEKIEFRLPQATGWAIGAHYDSRHNALTLEKDVHLTTAEPDPADIVARHGFMSKEPRGTVLYEAQVTRRNSTIDAAQLRSFLRPDDSVERIVGSGGVHALATGPTTLRVSAPEAVLYLKGRSNEPRFADLTGGTTFDASGSDTMSGSADSVRLEFAAHDRLSKVHAQGNVKLVQPPKPSSGPSPEVKEARADSPGRSKNGLAGVPGRGQKVELQADALDFWLTNGNQLVRAETSENAQITLTPENAPLLQQANTGSAASSGASPGERTVITAAKFYARFRHNRIDALTGMPDARVVSYTPGQSDRVSTSRLIEFAFAPSGGVFQVTQRDNFHYQERLPDGTDRAGWAQSAIYSVAIETLTLQGNPRLVEGGMTTTARVVRINRKNGDADAEGDVKTTYSDVKPQPGGALLASDEPIHVTARSMTAQRATATAHYSGDARLWQGANIIAAPAIDFDREKRTVVAIGSNGKRVATILTQQDKTGKQSPVNVNSARLTYSDNQRLAQFEGNVVVRSAEGTLTANHVDVYLKSASGAPVRSSVLPSQASQVDRIVAGGNVVLQQPARRATGEKLVYTAALDQYVLTGGSPTIFDAERGTVTGASLTFYNRDDRVLVEGGEKNRAVTHTRVSK